MITIRTLQTAQQHLGKAVVTAVLLSLSACASVGGLGGTTSLACPLPDGTSCKSLSKTYADPGKVDKAPGTEVHVAVAENRVADLPRPVIAVRESPNDKVLPLRSAPRVLRLWVAPYEDADGDLFDEMRVYLHLDAGAWNVEHRKELATRRFAPLRAPTVTGSAEPSAQRPTPAGTGPSLQDIQGLSKAVQKEVKDGQ